MNAKAAGYGSVAEYEAAGAVFLPPMRAAERWHREASATHFYFLRESAVRARSATRCAHVTRLERLPVPRHYTLVTTLYRSCSVGRVPDARDLDPNPHPCERVHRGEELN